MPKTDPLRKTAQLALAGTWGPLPDWKKFWYEWAVRAGLVCVGTAKTTSYGPFDRTAGAPPTDDLYFYAPAWYPGGGGRYHTSADMCARNPEIPWGSIIWTSYGLRIAVDTGGHVTLQYVPAGCTANFDLWAPTELDGPDTSPFCLLRWGWGSAGNPSLAQAPE